MTKREIIIGLLILFGLLAFINKDFFTETLPTKVFGPERYEIGELKIVLNTEATELSPYGLNLNNLIRTSNVYEGLVAFDPNLRLVPSLAVSWGNLDETTWEFKLRKEVMFHDQSAFDASSVVTSFEDALKNGGSQVKTLLSTVDRIDIVDPYTIQVKTKAPDPLILSKLTKFFISRPGNMGTGPYKIVDWVKDDALYLTSFTDYWGKHGAYKNVQYQVIRDKFQRRNAFDEGEIDILVSVPRDQALTLPQEQVKTSYSLEVNFLMFKLDDPILSNPNTRKAILTLFDPDRIEAIGNDFVRQASQFVAPGVYGYNPNIPYLDYEYESQARNLFGDQRRKINLDYLTTYRTLAEYLQKQLTSAGFLVKSNPISPKELLDRIKNNESQLFLIGWQSSNGDAGDFLDAFIHSEGEFNGGRYVNKQIDALIEKSRQELDPDKRLKLLQQIMAEIQTEIIGIPLFESSRLYAVKDGIRWEPRLDGLVLATEVR